MWQYTPTLNFDASKILNELWLRTRKLEIEVPRYLQWVDEIVSSHKSPTLDEFRVRFDIDRESKISIDSWVRFAMEKRVKKLTIDLSTPRGDRRITCYKYPSASLCCNSLTSLELAAVDICGEVLESFLCSCPALEYLSVAHSEMLKGLKVAGPSLNLKYLTINYCLEIKELEISAPNLVSFCYLGPRIRVQYENVPKLVEISLGTCYADNLYFSFSDLGCHLSQLEVLKLQSFCDFKVSSINFYSVSFPL